MLVFPEALDWAMLKALPMCFLLESPYVVHHVGTWDWETIP